MKLRIEGNTLRLRLSESELDTFKTVNKLKECIGFDYEHQLCYSLEKDNRKNLDLKIDNKGIQVVVPVEQTLIWLNSRQVGMEDVIEINNNAVRVIVEKDLKPKKERYK
jgi:hypothetical protein